MGYHARKPSFSPVPALHRSPYGLSRRLYFFFSRYLSVFYHLLYQSRCSYLFTLTSCLLLIESRRCSAASHCGKETCANRQV